ncbi:MAG: rod shape-determining protein MreC [Verrucomicrobia bacterium]|nr:rod shape-determining protein MreC [Verrucomicrobiota bacterium]
MRHKGFLVWVILGAVLLIVLNLPGSVSHQIKAAVREGLSPLQGLIGGISGNIKETVTVVRGLGGIVEENREMASDLVRLRNDVRARDYLEDENLQLRQQLQFLKQSERTLIPCEIIARDIAGWWQTVRLNKGAIDGVVPQRAVVTTDGVIGKTVDTSVRTSDVLLISDSGCKVSAKITRTGAFGVVSGQGLSWNGQVVCRMDFINVNVPVRPGDEVVSSGLGGVFPQGLLIGYVEKVYTERTGLYQYADVIPKADLGSLSYAFVVMEEEDPIASLLKKKGLPGAGGAR